MNPSERPVSSTPVPLASIALPRRADPLDREREIEQRRVGVAGRILDRDPGDPGRDRPRDVGGHAVGLDREPALEVGVDRQLDGRRDRAHVGERLLERHTVVRPPDAPGETRAGRRQRLEAEARQIPRAADVPRVRHHEAAGLMESPERRDALLHRCHAGTIARRGLAARGRE